MPVNIRRVEQLMRRSDARPYKAPSRWGTAWYKGPALDTANRMHGDALPSWYPPAPYSRTDWWRALTPWLWIAGEENPNDPYSTLYTATNTRIQVRNLRLHVRRSSWTLENTLVAPTSRNYSYTVTGGDLGVTDRSEASNGGGMSYKLLDNARSCPHPFGNSVGISDPWNVTGIAVDLECRRIMDNPGGTDDRAQAHAVLGIAVDLYPFANAPQPNSGYWVFAVAAGFARVTNDWQFVGANSYFTGARPGLDVAQLPSLYTSDLVLASAPADWTDGGGGTNPGTPPPTSSAKRIMFVGDSLTAGDDYDPTRFRTHRGRVLAELAAAGISVDAIGREARAPAIGGDPDCEAWGGAFISHPSDSNNILSRVPVMMAAGGTLDAIVLYIGWNDVYNYTTNIADRYTALFNAIRAAQPNAVIVVCTLTPQRGETESQTAGQAAYAALNARVRQIASTQAGVRLADLASLPMVPSDYWDVIHYLQPGADKVGVAIANALKPALAGGAGSGGGTAPPSGGGGSYVIPDTPKVLTVFPRLTSAKLTVAPGGARNTAPEIRTASLTPGSISQFYSVTLDVTGDPAPTITQTGTLPAGLTRSGATISGTPTTAGTSTITITATNSVGAVSRTYTLSIVTAPTITSPSSFTMFVGQAATGVLSAAGTGPFTWVVDSGTLPPGVALVGGAWAGIPTSAGTYNVTVRVIGASGTATQAVTITTVAASSAPVITTTALADATLGSAYSQTIAGTGATPRTWAIVAGSLPPGVSLNTATGALTGTPTATGGFVFVAKLFNDFGASELQLSIRVLAAGATTATSPWTALLKGR